MAARKPTPPEPALGRLPDLVEVLAEISDSEVAVIRDLLPRRERLEIDAARNVAAKKRAATRAR